MSIQKLTNLDCSVVNGGINWSASYGQKTAFSGGAGVVAGALALFLPRPNDENPELRDTILDAVGTIMLIGGSLGVVVGTTVFCVAARKAQQNPSVVNTNV